MLLPAYSTMQLFSALLLLLGAIMYWHHHRHRRRLSVPVVPGLPMLGNVVALGRGGVAFISKCRQRFGDVFCLQLLGQDMVFVFDPALISKFFKAPESSISFKPAVEQFTQRVYGLPSKQFFAVHEPLLARLRQLLVPDRLSMMGQQLLELAQPELDAWKQQGQVELWSSCQRLVFVSAGQVLFGQAFFRRHGADKLLATFITFEANFEVAASPVPHLLLPAFRSARASLLSMFHQSIAGADFCGTVVEQLLQGCGLPEQLWPNLLLAVMWASQANSMAALFWSVALLLLPEQALSRQRILTELQDAAQQHQGQQHEGQQQQQQRDADAAASAAMLKLALDRRSHVSRCVAEAVRLRLHSIAVRYVAAETLVLIPSSRSSSSLAKPLQQCHPEKQSTSPPAMKDQVWQVPRGTVLAICPFESHHDSQLFPEDAWAFNPDRQLGLQGLDPGSVVPGIAGMAFGGGFWRCPGRFFAEMELSALLQLILRSLPGLQPAPAQSSRQAADLDRHGTDTPLAAAGWWAEVLEYGIGSSVQQATEWQYSADPNHLLPACNLQRLVGFKVPHQEWRVLTAGN